MPVSMRVCDVLSVFTTSGWSLRQESNLYLALRRRPFYPLNYGEEQTAIVNPRRTRPAHRREGGMRGAGASVLAHGVDQVQRAGFPGLAAQGEAAREVVEDVQRAHGAREALLVGDIEVAGQALAQGEVGAGGVWLVGEWGVAGRALARGEGGAGGAFPPRPLEAVLARARVAGDLAAVVAPAAEQGQRGLLEQGAFGAARGGVAAHDHPGEL